MKHYTYLITNLNPTSAEKYYIGVHSGPKDPSTDGYMSSSHYLQGIMEEQGLVNFEKIVIREWLTRLEADEHERQMHIDHNAARNPIFYNKKNGTVGFHTTAESTLKHKQTINSDKYKNGVGLARIEKRRNTLSFGTGKKNWVNGVKKLTVTLNSPAGQERVRAGIVKRQALAKTRPGQKRVADGIAKMTATMNSPEYKAMLKIQADQTKEMYATESGKLKKEAEVTKAIVTRNSSAYIKATTFTCEYCQRDIRGKGNYNMYHGDNCKNKLEEIK